MVAAFLQQQGGLRALDELPALESTDAVAALAGLDLGGATLEIGGAGSASASPEGMMPDAGMPAAAPADADAPLVPDAGMGDAAGDAAHDDGVGQSDAGLREAAEADVPDNNIDAGNDAGAEADASGESADAEPDESRLQAAGGMTPEPLPDLPEVMPIQGDHVERILGDHITPPNASPEIQPDPRQPEFTSPGLEPEIVPPKPDSVPATPSDPDQDDVPAVGRPPKV